MEYHRHGPRIRFEVIRVYHDLIGPNQEGLKIVRRIAMKAMKTETSLASKERYAQLDCFGTKGSP